MSYVIFIIFSHRLEFLQFPESVAGIAREFSGAPMPLHWLNRVILVA